MGLGAADDVYEYKTAQGAASVIVSMTNENDVWTEQHNRAYLAEHYGFECRCNVCSLPDEVLRESDERLYKMEMLYARFARWGTEEISGREAVSTAKEIWAIGEDEGYWSERGQLAADVAWVAASHSE